MLLSLVLFSVLIWQLYKIMEEYIHPHDISSSKHHEDLKKLGFPAIIRICTDYQFQNFGYKNNDHYFMCRFLAHHNGSENSSCKGVFCYKYLLNLKQIQSKNIFFVDFKDNVEMNSTEIFKEIFLSNENNTKIHWNLNDLKFK